MNNNFPLELCTRLLSQESIADDILELICYARNQYEHSIQLESQLCTLKNTAQRLQNENEFLLQLLINDGARDE